MDLLQMTKPLTNDHPYLKAAFQGFQGSGKTFTAMIVAAGLHDQLGGAQIVIYDTEIASAFLMPQFEKRGIKGVRNIKSRSLKNLTNVIDAAEKFDKPVILLIDSITHVWKNLVYEWKTQKRKSYLTMHDWGILIPKWEEEFSRRFLESKVHIIFTGRAGYSYDDQENEETGKKELKKTGTRMKVQGETGFEPSLLVEMEQHQEAGKSGKSKKVYVTATILKDRYDIINGQTFRNPTFAKFKPVINQVLSGTAAGPVFQDSREEFTIMNAGSEWKAKKEACLEEIQNIFTVMGFGNSKDEKQLKFKIIEELFQKLSWKAVEQMRLPELEKGLAGLREFRKRWEEYVSTQKETMEPVEVAEAYNILNAVMAEQVSEEANS